MLEIIVNDVLSIFRATFLNGDWLALAIAFGSVAVAAILMRRGTQIGSMTLLSLIVFALGCYLRGIFSSATPATVDGGQVVNQLEANWAQFMNMQAGTLLAYFLTFMLAIFLLFALKTVAARG